MEITTPQLGTPEYTKMLQSGQFSQDGQIQQGSFIPQPASSPTIDVNTLTQGSPLVLPETSPTSTALSDLNNQSEMDFSTSQLSSELSKDVDSRQTQVSKGEEDIWSSMKAMFGLQEERAKEEEGLQPLSTNAMELRAEYEVLQRNEVNELRALEGSGLTDAQKNNRMREINRKYSFERADKALELDIAERRLDRASQALDRKYALKLEPLKQLIEFQQFFYQNNSQLLSKAEDRKFSQLMEDNKRQYEFQQSEYQSIGEMALLAAQNGAPASLVTQISNAENRNDAIRLASGYVVDPLDRQIKQAQLAGLQYENQIARANMEATQRAVENGQLTPAQGEAVNDLTVQLRNEPSYKEMFEIRAGYNTAKVGFEQSNGFGDIAMVNGYQRMIDPGATVRGEDIKTQAEATAYIQKVLNVKGQIFRGDRMTDETRGLLNKAVDEQYTRRVNDFDATTKARYENIINRNPMLSGSVTFDDIGDGFTVDSSSQTTQTIVDSNQIKTLDIGSVFEWAGANYKKVGDNEYEEI